MPTLAWPCLFVPYAFLFIYLFLWKWWPVSLALAIGSSKLGPFFKTRRCGSKSDFTASARRPRLSETLSALELDFFVFFPSLSSQLNLYSLQSGPLLIALPRWFNPFPCMLSALVLSCLDFNRVVINPSPTGLSLAYPWCTCHTHFPRFVRAVQISASIHPSILFCMLSFSASPACITTLGFRLAGKI